LGNLDAKRDWGHAKDYVEAMWLMLQQPEPEDFVIATGVTTSVRDFIKMSFAHAGIIVDFKGHGIKETGVVKEVLNPDFAVKVGDVVVEVDARYFRPTEVDLLLGDATKAKEKLGWVPKHSVEQLAKEMVESDLELFKKNVLLAKSFKIHNQYE
jgi:GDPmannose 4,6-dehydratase